MSERGATVLAVGISHKVAPVAVRERLAFTAAELPSALSHLRESIGAAVLLSTCNRTELYTAGADDSTSPETIIAQLAKCKGTEPPVGVNFYLLREQEAVRHLYRVAAGVDSMVLGEAQILGQVREALGVAQRAGTVDPLLSRLFRTAISVGRRARSETGISRYAVSVSSTAVALARRVLGDLAGCTVLVVSAGESGKLAAKSLVGSGASRVLVTNRTYQRACELAARLEGEAVPFEGLPGALAMADIVISATGAEAFVLGVEEVGAAIAARNGRPLLLIDIAVPRDVDPRVRELAGVHLYDIDDLQGVSHANLRQRAREVHKVEAIVEEEVERFGAWWRSLEVVPTIVALRQRAEAIRREEVERTLRRLTHLSPRDQGRVEAMAMAIVNKLLHRPIARLKEREAGQRYTEAVRSLFDLDDVS